MRRVKQDDSDEMPSGDSFLDIVANMVGILVLLVVVVGVRAGRQVFTPVAEVNENAEAEIAALEERAAELQREASRDHRDALEAKRQLQQAALEQRLKEKERSEMTLYATKLRAELDEARQDLAADDQRSLETSNAIAQAQLTLERLAREQIALSSVEPEVDQKVVAVSPKPIVNGQADENRYFFRLRGERLIYVPVEELMLEVSRQSLSGGVNLVNPGQAQVRDYRAGPLEGFQVQARFAYRVGVSNNAVRMQRALLRAEITPVSQIEGEPFLQALNPGGSALSRLELLDPQQDVVVLMIYPDSFDAAIDVENVMRERGLRIAKTLMEPNETISFSSNGQRIVTQ